MTRESRYPMLGNRNKALLSLLIYQGLTPQNIINLRVEDIDLDSEDVCVMATKKLTRRSPELRSNQVLTLHLYVYQDCVERIKTASARLFMTKRGENLIVDTLNRML